MAARNSSTAGAARAFEIPAVVYFWGAVRSHVNHIASEYARRLHSPPIWLDVRDPDATVRIGDGDGVDRPAFALRAGREVQLATVPPGPAGDRHSLGGRYPDLEDDVREVLTFPPVVHTALETASRAGRPATFLLTNIDRLRHLAPMFGTAGAEQLFGAFRRRGIVLVLTSEGLLPLPRLDLECSFEVVSSPGEEWFEAEVRPGVPISCCAECPGAIDGNYASCAPEFRNACPIRFPFESAPA